MRGCCAIVRLAQQSPPPLSNWFVSTKHDRVDRQVDPPTTVDLTPPVTSVEEGLLVDDDDELGRTAPPALAGDERQQGVCTQEVLLLERIVGSVGRMLPVEDRLEPRLQRRGQHEAGHRVELAGKVHHPGAGSVH